MKNFDRFSNYIKHDTNIFRVAEYYAQSREPHSDEMAAMELGLDKRQILRARFKLKNCYDFNFKIYKGVGPARYALTSIKFGSKPKVKNKRDKFKKDIWTQGGLMALALGITTA